MVPPTVTVCDTALRPVLTSTVTESAVSVTPPPSDSENDCTSSEPATPPGPMTTTPVAAATARIVVEPVRRVSRSVGSASVFTTATVTTAWPVAEVVCSTTTSPWRL